VADHTSLPARSLRITARSRSAVFSSARFETEHDMKKERTRLETNTSTQRLRNRSRRRTLNLFHSSNCQLKMMERRCRSLEGFVEDCEMRYACQQKHLRNFHVDLLRQQANVAPIKVRKMSILEGGGRRCCTFH